MGAAFAYDTYTNPSKNNGVLRATLTLLELAYARREIRKNRSLWAWSE